MAESVQVERNEFLARVELMARLIQRVSTWGAGTALVVGLVTLVALWPWLPGPDGGPFAVTVAVVAVLVVPPLRIMWHGRRISAVYGDSIHIEQVLEAVPGALEDALVALRRIGEPTGRGLRRAWQTWRAAQQMQDVWESSPAIDRLNTLIEPIHPRSLGLTMTAVWFCLGTIVLGPLVIVVALVAQAVT